MCMSVYVHHSVYVNVCACVIVCVCARAHVLLLSVASDVSLKKSSGPTVTTLVTVQTLMPLLHTHHLLVILDVVVQTAELSDLKAQHGHDEVDGHDKGVDPSQHQVLSLHPEACNTSCNHHIN